MLCIVLWEGLSFITSVVHLGSSPNYPVVAVSGTGIKSIGGDRQLVGKKIRRSSQNQPYARAADGRTLSPGRECRSSFAFKPYVRILCGPCSSGGEQCDLE